MNNLRNGLKDQQRLTAGVSVLLFGICLMLYGIHRDEMAVVLNKAVHICLECIGLG